MSAAADEAGEPRIAVLVDREGLGDALLKFPLLRALRRAYPHHRIWWIATHQTAMADDLAPWTSGLIDRVVAHAGLTSPERDAIPRLRQLPAFDVVFDMRSRFMSVLLARLLIRHRGFYACLPGFLLSDRPPPGRFIRPKGIAQRALSTVEAATGRPADWTGTFDVSAAAARLAAERLPPGPRYVGLAPGSREARKNWPRERFAALAQALTAKGLAPVFLIGPQERAWVDELRASVPQALFPGPEPFDPALGIGSLEFVIALGRNLAAAVANDSGIGHLLAAMGTPLVSLFGPSEAERWAPFGERCRVVRAQDFGGATMQEIPVDAVSDALDKLLAGSDR